MVIDVSAVLHCAITLTLENALKSQLNLGIGSVTKEDSGSR
jgi:hypothetical protein